MHFGSDEYGFVGVAPRRVVVDLCGRFVSPWIDRAVHPRIAEKRNPQRSSEGEGRRRRRSTTQIQRCDVGYKKLEFLGLSILLRE
jgi:hypothetical protein